MKLATYRYDDGIGPALVTDAGLVDLRSISDTLREFIAKGEAGLEQARVRANDPASPYDPYRLQAPVPEPRSFIGVGLNYRDHAAETGRTLGKRPTLFAKLPGSAAAPFADLACPPDTDTLDYEGELGFVIGRHCRGVSDADAPAYIAGYVIVNDLTVRALGSPETLLLAKSGPGRGPFGPWITTSDEVGDPHDLAIRTFVNGELRQDSSTRQMHCSCWKLLAFISRHVPLEPGDVVATGSPAGSGVAFAPPLYLRPGDIVRVEIDRLGAIENCITSGVATNAQDKSR